MTRDGNGRVVPLGCMTHISEDADVHAQLSNLWGVYHGQERTMCSMEQRLKAVEARLEQSLRMTAHSHELRGPSLEASIERTLADEQAEIEEEDKEPSVIYEVDTSMWDAAFLLSFSRVRHSQKFVIAFGLLLNICLQLMLLLVVQEDMVKHDGFSKVTVEQMVNWRIEQGHGESQLNSITGQTLLQQLCSMKLWSYEQDQYNLMYSYLYESIPGWVLTVLALTLWAFTIMGEFRRSIEQAFTIWSLPKLNVDDPELQPTDGGFEIVGISTGMRLMSLACLSLPRMMVLFWLAVVGCEYLAETVSLHDIVLNSLALAFVIDVDELLANVLLSRRTLTLLGEIQPIHSGRAWKYPGCAPMDIFRYLLCVFLVVFSCLFWLRPFSINVRSAANALCGGELDFSWEGGTASNEQVILNNNTNFVSLDECSATDFDRTIATNYMGYRKDKVAAVKKSKPVNRKKLDQWRTEAVLMNGFKECAEGEILDPKSRLCHKIPATLRDVLLSMGVRPGGNSVLPECKRFDSRHGTNACEKKPDPPYCQWNWLSKVCEGKPPGSYYSHGCEANGTHLNQTCYIWEDLFGLTHPTKNCEIVNSCAGDIKRCFLAGELLLQVHNETTFTANKSTSEAAIRFGLAAALQVPSKNVAVLQVSGWDFNFPSNLKQLASADYNPECEKEKATEAQTGGACEAESYCAYDKELDGCFDKNEEHCDCPEAVSSDSNDNSVSRRLQAGTVLQDPYQRTSVVAGGRALVKWAVSEPPMRLTPGFLQSRLQALRHRTNRAFQGNTNGSAGQVISNATFFQPGTFSQLDYGKALEIAYEVVKNGTSGEKDTSLVKLPAPQPQPMPPTHGHGEDDGEADDTNATNATNAPTLPTPPTPPKPVASNNPTDD